MDKLYNIDDRVNNALVVEGGAMRGIFSTGVLDAFLEKDFNPFHICIGVSAGSTNIAAYLAKMYQRNYKVYIDYSTRPDFINLAKFLKGGHLVDLDWLWNITIKEIRLDIDKIINSKSQYLIGVTEINEGKIVYLQPEKTNLEDILKASSSIPVFYRNSLRVMNMEVVDGGIADPIPVIEAYKRGATNIVVIRSRPFDYHMKSSSSILNKIYFKKHPKLLRAIENRHETYRKSIEFIRKPPKGVNITEVNPPREFKTKRLTKNISFLKHDYDLGYRAGLKIVETWNNMS